MTDRLRKLIEGWRHDASKSCGDGGNDWLALGACADELERALEGCVVMTPEDRAVLEAAERWLDTREPSLAAVGPHKEAQRGLALAARSRRAAQGQPQDNLSKSGQTDDPVIRLSDLEELAYRVSLVEADYGESLELRILEVVDRIRARGRK